MAAFSHSASGIAPRVALVRRHYSILRARALTRAEGYSRFLPTSPSFRLVSVALCDQGFTHPCLKDTKHGQSPDLGAESPLRDLHQRLRGRAEENVVQNLLVPERERPQFPR